MTTKQEHLALAVTSIGILSLGAGLASARLSNSVVAPGVVTFLTIGTLAALLKNFFGRWTQDRLTENPEYRAVLSQHFAKLRQYSFAMLVFAVFLAVYAMFEASSLAAVGAGIAAGLPVLWHIMRSALESRAIKP